MAKRFSDTEVWAEDWFLDMPNEYKMFWFYMLAKCDHAGLFKVNLRSFRGLIEVSLTSTDALKYFNAGKNRIRVLNENLWFIEDFFVYQYGTTFNTKNRLHESISLLWKKNNIDLTSIRGLLDLKDGVKDKDKVKDKEIQKEGVGENKCAEQVLITPEVKEVGSELTLAAAKEAWDDQRWREQICLANYLNPDQLKQWMYSYNASIANDAIAGFNAAKYKKMFNGWLQSQVAKGRKLPDKPSNGQTQLRTLNPQ